MTESEREFLLKHLQDGRDSLLHAIAGLSEQQLNFKPPAGRWSIADCVEHIVLTENSMFERATTGTPNPSGVSLEPERYERFARAVVGRSRKVAAPEGFRPGGHFASAAEASKRFLEGRERAVAYARRCPDDLRHLFAVHPLLGEIDCYRFLLLLALHPARHAAQIEEIKQDSGFPPA